MKKPGARKEIAVHFNVRPGLYINGLGMSQLLPEDVFMHLTQILNP